MKKHHWKRLFFLLLMMNIVGVVFAVILVNLPIGDSKLPHSKTADTSEVLFQIKTNKNDLNRVINHYLEKELSGTFEYEVFLNDEVELSGELPIFNETIEMKLTFEPRALENGDLILDQKNIYIGKLKLPVPLVMKFVRESYRLPDWVTIQPNEKRVYVSLQNMKMKSDLKVRVDEFDLKNDDIEFSLQVPMN